MIRYTRKDIQKAVETKGYKWFEGGDYNLNIVGIRNSETNGNVTNKFDDYITVSYSVNSELKYHQFEATTDPGLHWEQNLLNRDGVAILVPNQYRGSHQIGLHQNKYEALRQVKPLQVYRDRNKNGVYDFLGENIQEGIYGINIHRATSKVGGKSIQIDKWSAGCQVIASYNDFELFMELVNKSAKIYGNSFTYTLLESSDILI